MFKFQSIITSLILFAGYWANPSLASEYKFFGGFIPEGKPVIDGKIDTGEWNPLGTRVTYKFFGEDAQIKYHLMWDSEYLYIAAEVRDFELWVDNFDPAKPWISTFDDDAVKWEFDLDLSRDKLIQPSDRIFAINANGTAARFDQGDGSGSTIGAQKIDEILQSVTLNGTLNDNTFQNTHYSNSDDGFIVEAAISWKNLYGSTTPPVPSDGDAIGINITNIEDDTGGALDPAYYKEWKRVYDEITPLAGEESRPEFWAEFAFSGSSDKTAPAAIRDLSITNIHGRSAWINFIASGDNAQQGYAHHYEIRYSNQPITNETWALARSYPVNLRPKKAGLAEKIQIIGLAPSSHYYLGIKAIDEKGNASALVTAQFTTLPQDPNDKGFITLCPGKRYFCFENKEAFVVIGDNQGIPWPKIRTFYNGSMWDQMLGRFRNFYSEEGIQTGQNYLQTLADNGVNTIRLIAESYDLDYPVRLFTDVSQGPDHIKFNQDTLNFIRTLADEAEKVGINLILTPFDTFHYQVKWNKVPFSTTMGGPMESPDDLFLPENRVYLKRILKKLCETICDKKNILAIELINEFDSDDPKFGWNRAAFDIRENTLNELATYYRSIDPNHLIYVSSVRWDPKFTNHIPEADLSSKPGADTAVVLNNDLMDFNSTHMYYHDIRDPNLNHPDNTATSEFVYQVADLDNTVAPAVRVNQGLQYYQANAFDTKPYMDTESGPIVFYTKAYDAYFSQADDEQYFHNMIWAHLAGGDAGTGLRWPGEMLKDHKLTTKMRAYQKALSNFVASDLNFANFTPQNLSNELEIIGTDIPLIKIGSGNAKQGIIFLLKDQRKAIYGKISGATLKIKNLSPRHKYFVEFWNTYDPNQNFPIQKLEVTPDGNGVAKIALPQFNTSHAIKFYQGEEIPLTTGYMVTDDLWLRSVIQTEEKGPIEGVWHKGGEALTNRGDRVIWGYFYANPDDVSWGSKQNPELFVKIWFDVSGRVDVNYFHVSVPDIQVYTDYVFDGQYDQSGTTTMERRYVRHYFQNGQSGSEVVSNSASNGIGGEVSSKPIRQTILHNLDIGATINTEDIGPIDAIWIEGGYDSTQRGDEVVWGYFYASPNDVSWGSENNPEVFVKIWFDASGRIDANFFHVSVPDIAVSSDFSDTKEGFQQQSLATVFTRYIRHIYER